MPNDAQGVYQYDDQEPVSPLKDYLNRGMGSVSQVVADIRAEVGSLELLVDSDWVIITGFGSGIAATSGHQPRVRKVGDRVDLAGAITFSAGGALDNILTMPAGYLPLTQQFIGGGTTSKGRSYTLYVSGATAKLSIPTGYASASFVGPEVVPLIGSWYVS